NAEVHRDAEPDERLAEIRQPAWPAEELADPVHEHEAAEADLPREHEPRERPQHPRLEDRQRAAEVEVAVVRVDARVVERGAVAAPRSAGLEQAGRHVHHRELELYHWPTPHRDRALATAPGVE